MRAPSPALAMSDGQREMLEVLSRSQVASHRDVLRAKALLLAGQGVATTRIAQEIGVGPATVTAWRARFAEEGLAKFGRVRPGRGVKSTIPQAKIWQRYRIESVPHRPLAHGPRELARD